MKHLSSLIFAAALMLGIGYHRSATAQYCLGAGDGSSNAGPSSSGNAATTVFCASNFVVRVNVHFILRSDGTGNFSEVSDGGSATVQGYTGAEAVAPSTYWNGYQVAETLIYMANERNINNTQSYLPVGNNTPVNPTKLRYVLKGTYFHRSDAMYNYDPVNHSSANPDGIFSPRQFNTYGVNKGSEINIFMMGQNTRIVTQGTTNEYAQLTGGASGIGFTNASFFSTDGSTNIWTKMGNLWRLHMLARRDGGTGDDGSSTIWPWPMDQAGKMINHELGHLFGRAHANENDGCADTPPYTASGDNNTMTSGANQIALTPCQISSMQTEIGTYYQNYVTCNSCLLPNAFFTMPTEVTVNSCSGTTTVPVDGRGCFNETSYTWTLNEVDARNRPIAYVGGTYTVVSGQVGQFVVPSVQASKRYGLTITVSNGCGSHAATRYFTTFCSGSGPGGMRAVAVYPNPATAAGFTVQYEQEPLTLPLVRDQFGKPVRVERMAAQYAGGYWHVAYRMVGPVPNGLYLLETGQGKTRTVQQLSIQP